MTKEVTLRELAKLYARGTIDRSSYHKSRAELLNGIIEGRIKVKDIEQAAKQDQSVSRTRTEGDGASDISVTEIRPEMPVPDVERRRPDSNKRLLLIFIGIGVAILAALITLVVLLLQNSLT